FILCRLKRYPSRHHLYQLFLHQFSSYLYSCPTVRQNAPMTPHISIPQISPPSVTMPVYVPHAQPAVTAFGVQHSGLGSFPSSPPQELLLSPRDAAASEFQHREPTIIQQQICAPVSKVQFHVQVPLFET
ncbi:hypothetical protein Tsubulata_004031, partial [Turnera subulata]